MSYSTIHGDEYQHPTAFAVSCGHPADEFNDPTYDDGSVNEELSAVEDDRIVKTADRLITDELQDALNWIGQHYTAAEVTVGRVHSASSRKDNNRPAGYVASAFCDGFPTAGGETAIAACIALLAKLDRAFKMDLVA